MTTTICKVCGDRSWRYICSQCEKLSREERREVQKKYKPIPKIEGEYWQNVIPWYAVSNKGRVKSFKMEDCTLLYAPRLIKITNGRCQVMYDGGRKSFKVSELMDSVGFRV